MRIISGFCKGRKLISPKNQSIRPTSDRVREALFNILGHHVRGAKVLDLFSGTGAFGIEALSRGASSALFLDRSKWACQLCEENIALCKLHSQSCVIPWDLSRTSFPRKLQRETFDIIFMDPPYGKGLIQTVLENFALRNCLDQSGMIIIEHTQQESIPDPLNALLLFDQRKYGKTVISFLEKTEKGI